MEGRCNVDMWCQLAKLPSGRSTSSYVQHRQVDSATNVCREAVEVLTAGMHAYLPRGACQLCLGVLHTSLSHTSVTILVKQHSSGIPVQRRVKRVR